MSGHCWSRASRRVKIVIANCSTAAFALSLCLLSSGLVRGSENRTAFVSPQAGVGSATGSDRVIFKGNTHPLSARAYDRGPVSPSQPVQRMLLLLKRAAGQESDLDALLRSQQDPSSSAYHRWLTPQQFGQLYGSSDEAIALVTTWLKAQGFDGITVNNGRTVIEFSGTAGQVQSAFQTAIHRYEVNGETHIANQSDPSVPAQIAPYIGGIVSLNDFGRRSMLIRGPKGTMTRGQPHPELAPGESPDFTAPSPGLNTTFYWLSPYDFATIYDLQPLWNAGLDGSGQTIAIVGRTEIRSSDVDQFRAFFGLPANSPKIVIAGPDPGFREDELESDLDVQWSGAIAKGATIELVSSASTEVTDGVDLSALYIVDNNLAPVMSESYGACELFMGTAGNAFESALWQQAAAQGITVLVSSGDQGSTACDPTTDGEPTAVHPMAVNGVASTPYNVAVGGTDFNQYENWTTYWSSKNDPATKESALGYIPEIPWNDSCGSTTLQGIAGVDAADACTSGVLAVLNSNTIATSGGPSSCTTSDGSDATSCEGGWPKPLWQTGPGVPADGVRDVPDVSLFASNNVYNSRYIVCDIDDTRGNGCDPAAATQSFVAVGGTSASAPAMAGVMAIINQKYGRQGNANITLYRLATGSSGSSIFHDVTTDGNRVACTSESSDCVVPAGAQEPFGTTKGHDSTAGYDMVTGWGSIDIANLVNKWGSVKLTSTTTSLTLNNGTAAVTAVHGTAIQAQVDVTSSTGVPTGGVSLIGATANGSNFLGVLQAGAVSAATNSLPGGSYAVTAHYSGDTTFASSDSSAVNVNITPESSTTKVSVLNYDPVAHTVEPTATAPYGSLLVVRADVAGASGHGFATGSVSIADHGNSLGNLNLNPQGTAEVIPTNLLLGGKHTLKSSYSGDPSFEASSGSGSITVNPARMACAMQTNTTYLRAGWVLVIDPSAVRDQAEFTSPLGSMVAPTGTMTIYSGSTAVVGPTTVLGRGTDSGPYAFPIAYLDSVTIKASQLPSVTDPITLQKSGERNYGPFTRPSHRLTYKAGPVGSQIVATLSQYQNIQAGTAVTANVIVTAQNAPPSDELLVSDAHRYGAIVGRRRECGLAGDDYAGPTLQLATGGGRDNQYLHFRDVNGHAFAGSRLQRG